MKINEYLNQLRDFARPLVARLLLSKSFNYTVTLSPQDCVERLSNFEQPKTGFWIPSSKTVWIIREVNYSRFEIRTDRYGRGVVYNSAKATGMIMSVKDNTGMTVIKGDLRLGTIFLFFYAGFLASLVIFASISWVNDLGFILLVYAVNFLYIALYYRDRSRLEDLIHDTFSKETTIINEQ